MYNKHMNEVLVVMNSIIHLILDITNTNPGSFSNSISAEITKIKMLAIQAETSLDSSISSKISLLSGELDSFSVLAINVVRTSNFTGPDYSRMMSEYSRIFIHTLIYEELKNLYKTHIKIL
ncbi:hypothetical protein CUN60_06890 [Aquella oligotrophica]|uniref:Uncharacterized protein n=2 Tax=Aquella oligotrophica TaxID=2067065 RepID=A0A2I7N6F9_9NEIS|nr:hypothetical protein CUN60_06890 [Aquella oligotrophica]